VCGGSCIAAVVMGLEGVGGKCSTIVGVVDNVEVLFSFGLNIL